MKKNFKKKIGIIHLWLGLASGLVIFVVALTGALYVFSDDIIQITENDFRNVQPRATPQLSSSQLMQIAMKERKRFLGSKTVEKWDWQTLYRYSDAGKSVQFSSRHYREPNQFVDIFIDPYTGEILNTRDTYAHIFWDKLIELHTNLMLGDIGVYMVDFATLFLLVMLITGIILWFPKSKKGVKQRFTFKWKPTFHWKRKNYDLHNILGFYASWVVVFMVITGLSWAFGWVNNSMVFLLGGQTERQEILIKNNYNKTDSSSINLIYDAVTKMDAGAYCYHFNFSKDSTKTLDVYVRKTSNWTPGNTYYFNEFTGAFLGAKKYSELSAGEKYSELAGDIHYGWIFGLPSKIATFFGCLIVASLPVTGFLIWWGRKKTNNPKTVKTKSINPAI